jgi:hypothetical protein
MAALLEGNAEVVKALEQGGAAVDQTSELGKVMEKVTSSTEEDQAILKKGVLEDPIIAEKLVSDAEGSISNLTPATANLEATAAVRDTVSSNGGNVESALGSVKTPEGVLTVQDTAAAVEKQGGIAGMKGEAEATAAADTPSGQTIREFLAQNPRYIFYGLGILGVAIYIVVIIAKGGSISDALGNLAGFAGNIARDIGGVLGGMAQSFLGAATSGLTKYLIIGAVVVGVIVFIIILFKVIIPSLRGNSNNSMTTNSGGNRQVYYYF